MKTQAKFWLSLIVSIMIGLTACNSEDDDPQPTRKQQEENKDLLEVIGALEEYNDPQPTRKQQQENIDLLEVIGAVEN